MDRYAGREPLWRFEPLPPSGNLAFERLDFDNRAVVLEMFSGDDDAFVHKAFKSPKELHEYVEHQSICGPHSPKHGAADWIVRTHDRELVGLVHSPLDVGPLRRRRMT